MGRYLLIASSREDSPLPSNSQGLWGDGLDLPWKCDYKGNIHYQMNYWPSETANLGELHLPAIRFDAALVIPATKTAQTYYNAPGWVVAYTANAWGWTSPGAGMPWGPFFGGGGWLVQDIWEHSAFSRDRDFLRAHYPVLRGSAEFYLSIIGIVRICLRVSRLADCAGDNAGAGRPEGCTVCVRAAASRSTWTGVTAS